MAASKLNTLHLHLTDTASVPLELSSQPNITAHGAYGPGQTYSAKDIAQLVMEGVCVCVCVSLSLPLSLSFCVCVCVCVCAISLAE